MGGGPSCRLLFLPRGQTATVSRVGCGSCGALLREVSFVDDIARDNEGLVSDIQARAANGEDFSDLLEKLYTDNLPLLEVLCKNFRG